MPDLKMNVMDKVKWKCKDGFVSDFRVGAVWNDMYVDMENANWSKLIWFSQGVPRHAFFLWLAIRERLRTLDRLAIWKVKEDRWCVFCHDGVETHNHLFVECKYIQEVWRCLEGLSGVSELIQRLNGAVNPWNELILELSKVPVSNSIWSIIHRMILAAVVYFIWQERNKRVHLEEHRTAVGLARQIIELIRMKLLGLKVKSSVQVKRAAVIWDLGLQNGGFCAKLNCNDHAL